MWLNVVGTLTLQKVELTTISRMSDWSKDASVQTYRCADVLQNKERYLFVLTRS